MHGLLKILVLAGAGLAGLYLAKKPAKSSEPVEESAPQEPEITEAPQAEAAYVSAMHRSMDPLTLNPASIVTFCLHDGSTRQATIQGEGGLHILQGDVGMLTMDGDVFSSFEKENGEIIGGMYYVPADAEDETDE